MYMSTAIDQLRVLVETGTEEQIRTFIAEHFSEFPERVQKDISVQLFREAIQGEIQEREAILAVKKQAVEIIEALEAAEREEKK